MAAHISGQELNYTTPQGPIGIRRWGLGKSFLLLPGIGGSSASWGRLPHLISKGGAAALGLTPPRWWADLEGEDRISLWADTLTPLVRTLGKPVLVGWSLGCRLALTLAAKAPVCAVVLLCPTFGEPTEARKKIFAAGLEGWAEVMAPHLYPGNERGAKLLSIAAPDNALLPQHFEQAAKPFDVTRLLPSLERVKIFVYSGLEDQIAPAEEGKRIAQSLGAEFTALEGGHNLPWVQKDFLAEQLLRLKDL